MTLAARLGRAQAALGPRERALLLLHCLKEDRPEGPEIRAGLPDDQVGELNYFIGLFNSANREVGGLVTFLAWSATGIARRRDWLRSVRDWQAQNPEAAGFLKQLEQELAASLRDETARRWRELLAVEAVWEEIGAELGEHPAHPNYVSKLAEAKRLLREVGTAFSRRWKLPDVNPDLIEEVRALVRTAPEFAVTGRKP